MVIVKGFLYVLQSTTFASFHMFVQTKQDWCITNHSPIWISMKPSVCLPKTPRLFQPMTSMNSLCLGKFKSLDYTKVSSSVEALRIEVK